MTTVLEYVKKNYNKAERSDIAQYGCVSGCASGLIYYTDTVAFHDEYEEDIWNALYEDAEDQGMTIPELIASFNGAKSVGSMEQFKNLLTWYAVERACYSLTN